MALPVARQSDLLKEQLVVMGKPVFVAGPAPPATPCVASVHQS